jgi:hypothetical protein
MIGRMRAALNRKTLFVRLETNMEESGHNIQVNGASPTVVFFKDVKRKKQGGC